MADHDNMPLRPEDDALLKDLADAQAERMISAASSDSRETLIDWNQDSPSETSGDMPSIETELSAEENEFNMGSVILQLIIVIMGATVTIVLGWLFFRVIS